MTDAPELNTLLWYVIGASRGGENRAKIISALKERPANINQLSLMLGMEYRLVTHHIEFLRKNSLVVATGERYGRMYSLSPWLLAHYDVFEAIARKLNFSLSNR